MKKLLIFLIFLALALGSVSCVEEEQPKMSESFASKQPQITETDVIEEINPESDEKSLKLPQIVETNKISLETSATYYEPYPLAYYNAFYHQEMPDITFEIKNVGNSPVTVRVSAEYQGYSHKAVTTETIMPEETKVINLTIPLIPEKIEQINTKTKFSLYYKIEYKENGEWKVWDEATQMIDVYPVDTVVFWMQDDNGNWQPLHEYIAVFVTPKSDAVQNLLAIAKEYATDYFGRYSEFGLYRSLPGYQCYDCSDEEYIIYTALQVMAIYNALKYEYGVSYVNMPTAFATDKEFVQRVNLPEETLKLGSANCLDGTILFASALEAIGIRPYIVIMPEHAFIAWCADPECKYIDALETTMIGSAEFVDAWEKGGQELEEYWNDLLDEDYENGIAIDIIATREAEILPVK